MSKEIIIIDINKDIIATVSSYNIIIYLIPPSETS
jgi:hypothetical protein